MVSIVSSMLWKLQILFILKYVDRLSCLLIEVRERGGTQIVFLTHFLGWLGGCEDKCYWLDRLLAVMTGLVVMTGKFSARTVLSSTVSSFNVL